MDRFPRSPEVSPHLVAGALLFASLALAACEGRASDAPESAPESVSESEAGDARDAVGARDAGAAPHAGDETDEIFRGSRGAR